jgi:outer membrane protein assembly factor BamB
LIDLRSGTVTWQVRVDAEPLRSSALAGPVALALTRDGELTALGLSDGKERWQAEDEGSRVAGVIGTELILQVGPDRILGRSVTDGSERWSVPSRGLALGSWTTSGEDPVGIVATTTEVRAYDSAGRVRWQRPPVDTVAVAGELVVLATATEAELRDARTGAVLRHWDYRVRAVPTATFAETGVILKWVADVDHAGLVMLR